MNKLTIDTEPKVTDVTVLAKQGTDLVISDQAGYESAASILKEVKARYKEIESQRKEIVSPLDDAKKKIQTLFKAPLDLLEKAESFIKNRMIEYTADQERKAREEQIRIQKALDAEAEKQKRLLDAQIARAEASGKTDKAEMLQQKKEEVIPIQAPVIAPAFEAPKGISYKEKWSAVIVDDKLIPREYLMPNMDALTKIAGATKGQISIPGVSFRSEKIISSRS